MRSRRGSRPDVRRGDDRDRSDVTRALEAMSAGELRTFIAGALDRLVAEERAELADMLLTHAARGAAGWRPPAPDGGTLDEVKRFHATQCARGPPSRRRWTPACGWECAHSWREIMPARGRSSSRFFSRSPREKLIWDSTSLSTRCLHLMSTSAAPDTWSACT